jgi:Type IV secretion system pilin
VRVPNPVRADRPVGPPTMCSPNGSRTEEVATTHRTHTRHTTEAGALCAPVIRHRTPRVLIRLSVGTALVLGLVVLLASPAFAAGTAAPTLNSVIDNLRNWIVGFLAGLATLFLTIGGVRYLTAGGDPGQVEKAKTALKSAAIGYALAILAPLLVSILASVVGG